MDVSVVIPAYNEENYIANVLAALKSAEELSDILVVNDGSTDRTSEIARSFNIRVIDLPQNTGKSHAMWVGVNNTRYPYVLFLDADLVGITAEQIRSLYYPVYLDTADMTVGIFNSGRGMTDLAQKITPFLSGQRCVKRSILLQLSEDDWLSGFGIEMVLTRYAKDNNIRILEVSLDSVTHSMKEEKLGLAKGVLARLKMYWEIAKEFNRV